MAKEQSWEKINLPEHEPIPDVENHFALTVEPKTDLWRPSPDKDTATAPAIFTRTTSAKFRRAQVTVFFDNFVTTYDQGGLYLNWPSRGSKSSWIKAGVEFEDGAPRLSTVGTHVYSDWALAPITTGTATSVTIEAVGKDGALWIYAIFQDGSKQLLRETKWAFVDERAGDAEFWVGVGAAKPTPEKDDPDKALQVRFANLIVETA